MLIESQNVTSNLMEIVGQVFVLSVTILEISDVKMFMTLTLRMDKGQNVNMSIESPCANSYFMVVVMLSLSFTVCDIYM